jgi:ATP-dependent Clp protease ATP-binding subunit ClpA
MMWEPFSGPARHVFVRAQQVAQMFGSSTIGTEHMTFALAESDDEVGSVLAGAVDREAMRQLLGAASARPTDEMTFTRGAKQSIELAFESARRLNQNFIGTAHIALGIVASSEPPPLVATTDSAALRAALELAATHEQPPAMAGPPSDKRRPASSWKLVAGDDWRPGIAALLDGLASSAVLGAPGTRVSLTVASPGEPERTWSWVREEKPT